MRIINIFEAKTRLSELLERVQRGEEIVIGKHGEPIAVIISIKRRRKKRKLGRLKGEYSMSKDFDAPIPPSFFTSKAE